MFDDGAASGGRLFRGVHRFPRSHCFGFSAGIGQKPAGQPARESARNAAARSGSGQTAGCTRRNFFGSSLCIVCFMLNNGSRSGSCGSLAAIFCQRFTWKNDLFLGDTGYGRSRAARSFRTTIVVTARRSAAIVISAGLAALRRRIFRGRQIARARAALRASTAMASATTASPTAATATISASVTTAAIILPGAVVTAAGGIALRGIVMGREVLGRGSVGIRLAFFTRFGVLLFDGSGVFRFVMFLRMVAFGGVLFLVGSVRLVHVT